MTTSIFNTIYYVRAFLPKKDSACNRNTPIVSHHLFSANLNKFRREFDCSTPSKSSRFCPYRSLVAAAGKQHDLYLFLAHCLCNICKSSPPLQQRKLHSITKPDNCYIFQETSWIGQDSLVDPFHAGFCGIFSLLRPPLLFYWLEQQQQRSASLARIIQFN